MGKKLNQILAGKPNIASLEALEELLQYRASDISHVATHADAYYAPFPKKPKHRPFAKKSITNKIRWIQQPIIPLKEIQKRIHEAILGRVCLPDNICGGVKGKSTTDNAQMHQQSSVLVAMDIQDYFPSITRDQIYRIWREILGCTPEVADILTKLTTYKGCLPQGAPTSTALANIFLCSIDGPIRGECARWDVSYSAWVDDLCFSGKEARRIIPVAVAVLRRAGLKLSRRKLRVMGPRGPKRVTGIILGSKLSVPSDHINRLRAGIHKLCTGQIPLNERQAYLEQLEGSIAYVKSINPHRGDKLRRDLEIAKGLLPRRGL